jgi:hypothetical protein
METIEKAKKHLRVECGDARYNLLKGKEIIRDLLKQLKAADKVVDAGKACIKTYNAGNRVSFDEALKEYEELK